MKSIKNQRPSAAERARVRRRQRGAALVQYALLLGLIAIPALTAYVVAGPRIADNLTRIGRSLLGIEETP